MKKVTIKNLQGAITHGATFETQTEVDSWIASQRAVNSWGKVAGIYNESRLTEQEKQGAIEIFPEGDQHFFERQFQIEDQFTVEIEDITEEIRAINQLKYAQLNEDFGNKFIRQILLINKKKVEDGIFTVQTLDLMDENPALQKIERACRRGAIPTLKVLVENYNGPYFTEEEKSKFMQMINQHMGL